MFARQVEDSSITIYLILVNSFHDSSRRKLASENITSMRFLTWSAKNVEYTQKYLI